jgi:hypothetical protein
MYQPAPPPPPPPGASLVSNMSTPLSFVNDASMRSRSTSSERSQNKLSRVGIQIKRPSSAISKHRRDEMQGGFGYGQQPMI